MPGLTDDNFIICPKDKHLSVSPGKVCRTGLLSFILIRYVHIHRPCFFSGLHTFWKRTIILMPEDIFIVHYKVHLWHKDPVKEKIHIEWLNKIFIIGVTQTKQQNYGAHWPDCHSVYMTFPFKTILKSSKINLVIIIFTYVYIYKNHV